MIKTRRWGGRGVRAGKRLGLEKREHKKQPSGVFRPPWDNLCRRFIAQNMGSKPFQGAIRPLGTQEKQKIYLLAERQNASRLLFWANNDGVIPIKRLFQPFRTNV